MYKVYNCVVIQFINYINIQVKMADNKHKTHVAHFSANWQQSFPTTWTTQHNATQRNNPTQQLPSVCCTLSLLNFHQCDVIWRMGPNCFFISLVRRQGSKTIESKVTDFTRPRDANVSSHKGALKFSPWDAPHIDILKAEVPET